MILGQKRADMGLADILSIHAVLVGLELLRSQGASRGA